MKSSTNKFPARFQDVKLQSIRPLKRLSRKLFQSKLLKKTSARISQTVGQRADALAKAASFSTESEASKGSKLLLNLLLVRPWVLVIGFWLLAMGTGGLALEGMLRPRKLTMALPEPAIEETASARSDTLINIEQGSEGIAADSSEVVDASATTAATVAESRASGMPALALASLVGACAVGSLAISRRRAMIRMASVRARKGRARKSQPRATSSLSHERILNIGTLKTTTSVPVAKASATNRTANGAANTPVMSIRSKAVARLKNRRQRVKKGAVLSRTGSAIAIQQQNAKSRVLASRMNAQTKAQAKAQKRPSSVRSQPHGSAPVTKGRLRKVPVRAASRQQPVVSVVPANETRALDWTQSGIAHQFDVRPQRPAI